MAITVFKVVQQCLLFHEIIALGKKLEKEIDVSAYNYIEDCDGYIQIDLNLKQDDDVWDVIKPYFTSEEFEELKKSDIDFIKFYA